MGIFSRLSDLLKSNINDLIDKAEDPEKMVKQIIIDMQKELNESTQALGKAMAAERALNAENGEKLIEENNTEKQKPAPTLQVESIDVDTKYIEENIEKVNKAKSERQEETFVQSSSNLTNNHEGRDGNERNDDGDER